MSVQIQLRRDVAADWTAANPILAEGEIGLELDTGKFKIGNGVANWNTLPYAAAGVPIATTVQQVASANSVGTAVRYAPEDHAHAGINRVQISGNTSNTSSPIQGSLYLAGGNNVTLSQATGAGAATITISVANTVGQSVQTQNCVDLSLSGNTAGALALISSGTAILAGGNNITLSQNGQSITVSAFNQSVQTQNLIDATLAGNTSGALALISSGTLTLAGGNNITLSQNGNAVTVSGPNTVAQSVQTQNCVDLSLSGNTSGALALISSGTAILAGGNNITLSQNAQSITISAAAQTVQTQNLIDLSLAGNTSGALALMSSGTVILAGGNNITLSQNGQSITISAANETQTVPPIATAVKEIQSAGSTGTITRFAPEDHAHAGLNLLQISGNTSNTSNVVQGSVYLAGGNNITLSQVSAAGKATITISAANQTAGSQTLGMSNIGNTSGTTGVAIGNQLQFVFAGGNNITLSQSLNGASGTITISAFNQTVQTQNMVGLSLDGNTAGALALMSSGTVILAGGNNITLSQNGQSVTISGGSGGVPIATTVKEVQSANSVGTVTRYAAEDHAHAGLNLFQISGNTSNTSNAVQGSLYLAGGNNITLSQVSAAGKATVTISAAAQTVESQSIGMSNVGNTSGDTGMASGGQLRFVLAGGNNITLSQSLDGASGTVTISAFNQSVESQSYGMSNIGNTAGTTGIASGGQVRALLAGGNNVTLSQSVNGASATVSIAAGGTNSFFEVMAYFGNTTSGYGQSFIIIYPRYLQEFVSVSRAEVVVSVSYSTSADSRTLQHTLAAALGVYTRSGATLNLWTSASETYGLTLSSNDSTVGIQALNRISIPLDMSMTPGDYWFAFSSSTNSSRQAGGGQSLILSNVYGQLHANLNRRWGVNSAINTLHHFPGHGMFSVASAAFPSAIQFNEITAAAAASVRYPTLYLFNTTQ